MTIRSRNGIGVLHHWLIVWAYHHLPPFSLKNTMFGFPVGVSWGQSPFKYDATSVTSTVNGTGELYEACHKIS